MLLALNDRQQVTVATLAQQHSIPVSVCLSALDPLCSSKNPLLAFDSEQTSVSLSDAFLKSALPRRITFAPTKLRTDTPAAGNNEEEDKVRF